MYSWKLQRITIGAVLILYPALCLTKSENSQSKPVKKVSIYKLNETNPSEQSEKIYQLEFSGEQENKLISWDDLSQTGPLNARIHYSPQVKDQYAFMEILNQDQGLVGKVAFTWDDAHPARINRIAVSGPSVQTEGEEARTGEGFAINLKYPNNDEKDKRIPSWLIQTNAQEVVENIMNLQRHGAGLIGKDDNGDVFLEIAESTEVPFMTPVEFLSVPRLIDYFYKLVRAGKGKGYVSFYKDNYSCNDEGELRVCGWNFFGGTRQLTYKRVTDHNRASTMAFEMILEALEGLRGVIPTPQTSESLGMIPISDLIKTNDFQSEKIYSYDENNRLLSITTQDGRVIQEVIELHYDGNDIESIVVNKVQYLASHATRKMPWAKAVFEYATAENRGNE